MIDSHFVHSSRLSGNVNAGITLTGSITFPTDILGVVVRQGNIADSDFLGAPGTNYTPPNINNDFDLVNNTQDSITVSPDMRTVTMKANAKTASDLDEMRIITRHDVPPTANAGGPYAGTEGSPITLHGTASDADNDPISTFVVVRGHGVEGGHRLHADDATTLTPTITCNDDAVVTATLTAADAFHAPVTSNATVTVSNVAPVLGPLTVPATLIARVSGERQRGVHRHRDARHPHRPGRLG